MEDPIEYLQFLIIFKVLLLVAYEFQPWGKFSREHFGIHIPQTSLNKLKYHVTSLKKECAI